MADVFGPRAGVIARELTKLFETIERDTLDRLAQRFAQSGPPKGEIVVLVGPAPPAPAADDAALDAVLVPLLAAYSVKEAAQIAAERLDVPRKRAYARALLLRSSE
jgi:16S rRNA (cytidine1402-2'-O)-methyltransferase